MATTSNTALAPEAATTDAGCAVMAGAIAGGDIMPSVTGDDVTVPEALLTRTVYVPASFEVMPFRVRLAVVADGIGTSPLYHW